MSGGNPQDYHCPLCKGAERVEKVSVLFEASTAIGSYGLKDRESFLKQQHIQSLPLLASLRIRRRNPILSLSFLSFLAGLRLL